MFYLLAVGLVVLGGLLLAFPDAGWSFANQPDRNESWETFQGMSAVLLMLLGIAMLLWAFGHSRHEHTPPGNVDAVQVTRL